MCLLMISVLFISLNTYYLKKSLKLFSTIGSDFGKAPVPTTPIRVPEVMLRMGQKYY